MNELLTGILADPNIGLSPTSRVILLYLAQQPLGCRIEEIARSTGSKFRWIENQTTKLTNLGILRRIAPSTYALNLDREVSQ